MKNKTITISEFQESFLLKNFKNINQGVQECINKAIEPDESVELLRLFRAYSRTELKGVFTQQEWYFFIDSLNGTMTDGMFRFNSSALIAHCEDAQTYERTAEKYNVEMTSFCAKIVKLTAAQVEAVYTFVEEFWNDDKRNLETYSKALI